MRIASYVPESTKTHSEYVILIAFPRQQWLRERTSNLRYNQYIAWLVNAHFCINLHTITWSPVNDKSRLTLTS